MNRCRGRLEELPFLGLSRDGISCQFLIVSLSICACPGLFLPGWPQCVSIVWRRADTGFAGWNWEACSSSGADSPAAPSAATLSAIPDSTSDGVPSVTDAESVTDPTNSGWDISLPQQEVRHVLRCIGAFRRENDGIVARLEKVESRLGWRKSGRRSMAGADSSTNLNRPVAGELGGRSTLAGLAARLGHLETRVEGFNTFAEWHRSEAEVLEQRLSAMDQKLEGFQTFADWHQSEAAVLEDRLSGMEQGAAHTDAGLGALRARVRVMEHQGACQAAGGMTDHPTHSYLSSRVNQLEEVAAGLLAQVDQLRQEQLRYRQEGLATEPQVLAAMAQSAAEPSPINIPRSPTMPPKFTASGLRPIWETQGKTTKRRKSPGREDAPPEDDTPTRPPKRVRFNIPGDDGDDGNQPTLPSTEQASMAVPTTAESPEHERPPPQEYFENPQVKAIDRLRGWHSSKEDVIASYKVYNTQPKSITSLPQAPVIKVDASAAVSPPSPRPRRLGLVLPTAPEPKLRRARRPLPQARPKRPQVTAIDRIKGRQIPKEDATSFDKAQLKSSTGLPQPPVIEVDAPAAVLPLQEPVTEVDTRAAAALSLLELGNTPTAVLPPPEPDIEVDTPAAVLLSPEPDIEVNIPAVIPPGLYCAGNSVSSHQEVFNLIKGLDLREQGRPQLDQLREITTSDKSYTLPLFTYLPPAGDRVDHFFVKIGGSTSDALSPCPREYFNLPYTPQLHTDTLEAYRMGILEVMDQRPLRYAIPLGEVYCRRMVFAGEHTPHDNIEATNWFLVMSTGKTRSLWLVWRSACTAGYAECLRNTGFASTNDLQTQHFPFKPWNHPLLPNARGTEFICLLSDIGKWESGEKPMLRADEARRTFESLDDEEDIHNPRFTVPALKELLQTLGKI